MKKQKLKFEIIPSEHDPVIGAPVGVRVYCNFLNITAESTDKKTQYANKMAAIENLNMLLQKLQLND